jgi:hypothetical protein
MELLQTTFLSSTWGPEDIILLFYLFHCVVNAETDPTSFKKIVSCKEKNSISSEMRNLWVTRMKHRRAELVRAALGWAGITDGDLTLEQLNPFWDGENPPSIISIPHIATQALLEQVSLTNSLLISVFIANSDRH